MYVSMLWTLLMFVWKVQCCRCFHWQQDMKISAGYNFSGFFVKRKNIFPSSNGFKPYCMNLTWSLVSLTYLKYILTTIQSMDETLSTILYRWQRQFVLVCLCVCSDLSLYFVWSVALNRPNGMFGDAQTNCIPTKLMFCMPLCITLVFPMHLRST